MKEVCREFDYACITRGLLDQEIFGKWALDELDAISTDSMSPFYPMVYLGRDNPVGFLQFAVDGLSEKDKDRVDTQLSTAIRSWNPHEYTIGSLTQIADFALQIDLQKTIPSLGYQAEKLIDDPIVCTELIDIISGFSGETEPRTTLLSLYEIEEMHPLMTPNLFLGIVKEIPDNYPQYLAKFLQYLPFYKENYDEAFLPWTMNFFTDLVSWPTILKHIRELSETDAKHFTELVGVERIQLETEKVFQERYDHSEESKHT